MTKEWPRVLVGVTTYSKKDYMIDRCMNAIKEFDYPSDKYDVLIVDNTNDKGRYTRQLKRRGHRRVEHVPRGANSREALTKSQNLIRQRMLEGDYEYLLLVESDLLPFKDTLKSLLEQDKQVIGSTYIIGTGNVRVPCIFIADAVVGGMGATRPLGIQRDQLTGKNTKYNQKEIDDFLAKGGIQKVHGCGFGVTLIKREIVERTPFWCDERLSDKHSDVYFYLDMERQGVPVYVDNRRIVPHYPTDWNEVEDR